MTTNIERVEPKVVDGIEFYCSKDGSKLGMSQSGLALFCGVTETALRKLIASVRTKEGYKELEVLYGKELALELSSNQQAKVITAEACQKIVWYYAITKKNPVALNSLSKFSEIGINQFIKKVTGFEETKTDRMMDMLQEVLMTVKEMAPKVESLDNFNKATVELPGLQDQFNGYSTQKLSFDGLPFTINQWLLTKGMTLDRSTMTKLGRAVSEIYKANTQLEKPRKMSRARLGLEGSGVVTVYKPSDVPMLEVALSRLIKNKN